MFSISLYTCRSVAVCGIYEENEDIRREDPSVHQVSKKLCRYGIQFVLFTHLIYSMGYAESCCIFTLLDPHTI